MGNRVEFKLSMPCNNAWNGKWTGASKNYSRVKTMTDKKCSFLGLDKNNQSWSYSFGDGWVARVSARIVPRGERVKKSDGFYGYDWMIESIIYYNEIRSKTSPCK